MGIGNDRFKVTPSLQGTLIAGNFSFESELKLISYNLSNIEGVTAETSLSITAKGIYFDKKLIGDAVSEIASELAIELAASVAIAGVSALVTTLTAGTATPVTGSILAAKLASIATKYQKFKKVYDTFEKYEVLSELPRIVKSFLSVAS